MSVGIREWKIGGLLQSEQVIGGIEQSSLGGGGENDCIVFAADAETFGLQLLVLLYDKPDGSSLPCFLQFFDGDV